MSMSIMMSVQVVDIILVQPLIDSTEHVLLEGYHLSMNTGFRDVLPMYDILGCASDFAHNFRHLMSTTLNCGATNPY